MNALLKPRASLVLAVVDGTLLTLTFYWWPIVPVWVFLGLGIASVIGLLDQWSGQTMNAPLKTRSCLVLAVTEVALWFLLFCWWPLVPVWVFLGLGIITSVGLQDLCKKRSPAPIGPIVPVWFCVGFWITAVVCLLYQLSYCLLLLLLRRKD